MTEAAQLPVGTENASAGNVDSPAPVPVLSEAASQRAALMSDASFVSKYASGDQAAIARMQSLNRELADEADESGLVDTSAQARQIRDEALARQPTESRPAVDSSHLPPEFQPPANPGQYELPPLGLQVEEVRQVQSWLHQAGLPTKTGAAIVEFAAKVEPPADAAETELREGTCARQLAEIFASRPEVLDSWERFEDRMMRTMPRPWLAFDEAGYFSNVSIMATLMEHAARLYGRRP